MLYDKPTYNYKIILLGNYIEEYQYTKPQLYKKVKSNKDNTIDNHLLDYNLINRQNIIRRLMLTNPDLDKFITLTYEKNITNEQESNYNFKKFIQKLETRIKNIKYICIPERQKRQAIHYHLCTNIPYIENRKISKIWNHGFTRINRIKNQSKTSLYITKYISKEKRLKKGSKHYFTSKNLIQPIILFQEQAQCELSIQENLNLITTKEYQNKHIGKMTYNFYEKK